MDPSARESPAGPALAIAGLRKRYGPRDALAGVDLTLERGEVLGFVGPNGAGKTTLMKCILGLVTSDAGTIRALGFDGARDSLRIRERTGYLPGDLGLYPNQRGARFLEFALSFHPRADRARAFALARSMDVPLERRIKTYSTGMRQKLGLIQAFAAGADLLLLDEPTRGLDPTSQAQFLDLLQQQRDRGVSVLLSSHLLGEIEHVCHRVVFIDRGKLLASDVVERARRSFAQTLKVTFASEPSDLEQRLRAIEAIAVVDRDGDEYVLTIQGDVAPVIPRLFLLGLDSIEYNRPSLEDVYRRLYLEARAC